MNTNLTIIAPEVLPDSDREVINTNIEAMISSLSDNRKEINCLVYECVGAMTSSEDYARTLANKKGLSRFLGSVGGDNQKLQDKINSSMSIAQYAAQQILQCLAEQNLMSFDLITAVNNKLNASVTAIEGEINQIYAALLTFFKQSRSDVIRMENRVERLERNVNLLNWQNSIEYQMFGGTEYADLDNAAKIICIARDFYDITKGEWSTSDLLLLKTAMGSIGLPAKAHISYHDFLRELSNRPELKSYLLADKKIEVTPSPEYLPLLSGIKKKEMLASEDHYLVETTKQLLSRHNVASSDEEISDTLTREYLAEKSGINLDAEEECFDLMLELLFNLNQAEEMRLYDGENMTQLIPSPTCENKECSTDDGDEDEDDVELDNYLKFMPAEISFKNCEMSKAVTDLEELSEAGYAKANGLLYYVYYDGDGELEFDFDKALMYAERGYRAGDPCSAVLYALNAGLSKEERVRILKEYKPILREIAASSDTNYYEAYILGICYVNQTDEDPNYFLALQYFLRAASQNFYRAFYNIAKRYQNGQGVEKDLLSAKLWLYRATDFPFGEAHYELGFVYAGEGSDENALSEFLEAIECGHIAAYYSVGAMYNLGRGTRQDFTKAMEFFQKGVDAGDPSCYNGLGNLYLLGNGVAEDERKAVALFKEGAEYGDARCQDDLGRCYYNGWGVSQNRYEARRWFQKAADQGNQEAIDFLKKYY